MSRTARRLRLDQTQRDLRVAEMRARRAMREMAMGRRRRRTRPPRQRDPRAAQLAFQRDIVAVLAEVEALIQADIVPQLERLADEARQLDPSKEDGVRRDAPADIIATLIERAQLSIVGEGFNARLGRVTRRMAQTVSDFNGTELDRVFESTVGVGIPASQPFLAGALAAAARENVRRIRGLVEQQFAEAEQTITRGFRQGLRHTEIATQLQARLGVVQSRARLIARDQVASLNGELTRLRQTSAGVRSYIWRSSQDERVRDTHVDFDGTEYTWAEGSPEGHPGEPVNCRCVAEPVIGPLLDEMDRTG